MYERTTVTHTGATLRERSSLPFEDFRYDPEDDDTPQSIGFCTGCGGDIDAGDGYTFGRTEYFCRDCVTTCDECGETMPLGETYETSQGGTYCHDCGPGY